MITESYLRQILDEQFGGKLQKGSHGPDEGACCGRELLSSARGIEWTDSDETRCYDVREINDIEVSNDVRTKHMLHVLAAFDGSLDWPIARQRAVASRIAILTVQRIISELPGLPADVARACRDAQTLGEAHAAAAAATAAARANPTARERVFIATCQIWIEAARIG